MKLWPLPVVLLLLSGCATNDSGRVSDAGTGAAALTWLASDTVAIELDGKRYQGESTGGRCWTVTCRGPYWNVLRIDRRHVYKGRAVVEAADGSRLECSWVRYRSELDGQCRSPEGRFVRLQAA